MIFPFAFPLLPRNQLINQARVVLVHFQQLLAGPPTFVHQREQRLDCDLLGFLQKQEANRGQSQAMAHDLAACGSVRARVGHFEREPCQQPTGFQV